jgi:twitching motility protein PilT
VLGELRDAESARAALHASETGHLVLLSVCAPGVARAIDRLLGYFPASEQPDARRAVASGLRLVVNQRLLPTRDGKGQVAAFEVVPGSVPFAARIRDGEDAPLSGLAQRTEGKGVILLADAIAHLVQEDRVTLEAARQVVDLPGDLDAALKAPRAV